MDPQSGCSLDGDVRDGFGPETVTINKLSSEQADLLAEVRVSFCFSWLTL